jgi:GT2 family glycosyltransferase
MKSVSVVIPHHDLDNLPYLDECRRALRHQTRNANIVGENIVFNTNGLDTFAKKVNAGINRQKADLYLILSDDVVLGDGAVGNLAHWFDMYEDIIVNPMSNADEGKAFLCPPGILKQEVRIHELGLYDAQLQNWPMLDILMPRQLLGFYCTMISQKTIDKIGYLDEEFLNGYEDTDYCTRCHEKKIQPFIAANAFALHFGGVTINKDPKHMENTVHNQNYYKRKWGLP